MNILEAINSGKPFKRNSFIDYLIIKDGSLCWLNEKAHNFVPKNDFFSIDDVKANDWYLFKEELDKPNNNNNNKIKIFESNSTAGLCESLEDFLDFNPNAVILSYTAYRTGLDVWYSCMVRF